MQATDSYFADSALLPSGFESGVVIEVDRGGWITSVRKGRREQGRSLGGVVLPGMPNLHSHAFQRAMAGLAEYAGPQNDNFWSWRETMYRFLAHFGPDDVEAVAAQLYVELLKSGYTSVGEFHYLHNDPHGRPYADRAELTGRIIAAASASGIGLTLLPVLYQSSQFGGAPPTEGQCRFVLETEAFLDMLTRLHAQHRDNPQVRLGIAPHSLRAVPPEALRDVVETATRLDSHAPIHLHVAEQAKEVEDCQAWSGQRPIEWLLNHAAIDERWCFVHCTQGTVAELRVMAECGAVAGLCPTTEANLGDGLLSFRDFMSATGRFGIGTDSNVSTSPVEELRLLEYGQRLTSRRRNVSPQESGAATGSWLYRQALAGGAQTSGRPIGAIDVGLRADLLVLDPNHPTLCGRASEALIDSWVFSGSATPIRHVMVGGRWVVNDGVHIHQDSITHAYRQSVARLASS